MEIEANEDMGKLCEALAVQSESLNCTVLDTHCGRYNKGIEPDQCTACME